MVGFRDVCGGCDFGFVLIRGGGFGGVDGSSCKCRFLD